MRQFVYKTGRSPTTNILVYLCSVRARKSVNLFTRLAICLQDGEGSNDNNNNHMAFPRGGPERGNPAMTTKRLRQVVKETHQHKMLWENREKWRGPTTNILVYLCGVRARRSANLFTCGGHLDLRGAESNNTLF